MFPFHSHWGKVGELLLLSYLGRIDWDRSENSQVPGPETHHWTHAEAR